MDNARKNFVAVFFKEWQLFLNKSDELHQSDKIIASREAPFDVPVKAGEIRVFAQTEDPMVGLVLTDVTSEDYLVVPISSFTVPATEQELLIGKRVYQLWNTITAPNTFVSKSWIVDTLSPEDVKDIARAVSAVLSRKALPPDLTKLTGLPIVKMNDPRLDYEKRFATKRLMETPVCQIQKPKRGIFSRILRPCCYGLAACFVFMLLSIVVLENITSDIGMREPRIYKNSLSQSYYRNVEPRIMARCVQADDDGYADGVEFDALANYCSYEPMEIGTERYSKCRESDFVEVKNQPLSTFGLDVDTASYAMMRRSVQEWKSLPSSDSVRLEEFVNYFHYNYPEPKDGAPIGVNCELAECPWNKSHRLLRVGVQAKRIAREKLPPSNLVFLLDCSGSMNFNGGFNIATQSMRMLVDELDKDDSVAIVTYASDTHVKLAATKMSDKSKILNVINSLRVGGGTYGSGGIQLAYEEAKKNFDRKANNRVIIVTDGDFNVGVSSTEELVRMIEKKRESGVFLSVIGVGSGNYQDAMMKKLANAGNGNYAYVDSLGEARKIMLTEFTGSMYTVAKDVKLQLEFNPSETSAYRLLGYEHRQLEDQDFNDDVKDSGEIGSGHSMTAFYELIPVGVSNELAKTDALKYQKTTVIESDEFMTMKLRYKEPYGDVSKLIEMPLKSAAISSGDNPSEDFRFASAVAELALLLEDSKYKGSASIKEIISRAKNAKGDDADGYRAEFVRLAVLIETYLKYQQDNPRY